ncbi:MAG TPA: hypothetical protein VF389_11600 [Woeseiaceae bacterium]
MTDSISDEGIEPISDEEIAEIDHCQKCGIPLVQMIGYYCDEEGGPFCGDHFGEIECFEKHGEGCQTNMFSDVTFARIFARIEAEKAAKDKAEAALGEAVRALERIRAGDYPVRIGKYWFPDERANKHNRCVHGRFLYEGCECCIDEFIEAALATLQQANREEI